MTEIREVLAKAMRAQGKVDPDEVFALAEAIDDDPDPDWPAEDEQPPLPFEGEERGYGWEP